MLRALANWWNPAAPSSAAQPLAAASSAARSTQPQLAASSSSGITSVLTAEFFNAAGPVSMAADTNDELGVFAKAISAEAAKLSAAQAVWRERKIALLGSLEKIEQPLTYLQTAVTHGFYSQILQAIKANLIEFFKTPQAEIRDLLNKSRPHLDKQQQHVNDLIKQLHETTDPEAQKQIKIQMCDINIALLDEFIAMIHDIQVKIETVLDFDVTCEKIALRLLEASLLVMAQIAFPSLDAPAEREIRDYMGGRIRKEGAELDKELTRLEGELAQAWNHVTPQAAAEQSATDAPAPAKPTDSASVDVALASGFSPAMFAAATSADTTLLQAAAPARRF